MTVRVQKIIWQGRLTENDAEQKTRQCRNTKYSTIIRKYIHLGALRKYELFLAARYEMAEINKKPHKASSMLTI